VFNYAKSKYTYIYREPGQIPASLSFVCILPGQEKIPFIKIMRSNEMMQMENYRRSVGGA
jgi:hypothetical protein